MPNWITLASIIEAFNSNKKSKWSWVYNSRCKYVTIRVDTRDGKCVLMDRHGNVITLEEFKNQNTLK